MPGPAFALALLNWYSENARQMPWRDSPTPYGVWISEMMLQQTRVSTVIPYFNAWMERFPTIDQLSAASLQEVLNAWEGLGYYSRARNLHRAAQQIMAEYGGELPADVKELRKLPGIGPYTAGAIASIAFGLDEPLLDGNVRRVLARLFAIQTAVDTPEGMRQLWGIAARYIPTGRAGEYNQGLMELGALICVPKDPDCANCPVSKFCEGFALGIQRELPVLKPRPRTPHYIVTAAVIHKDGEVLIAQRPEDGLLGGMWEFPGGKLEPGEDLPTCLQREIHEELALQIEVGGQIGVYRHAYTHFKVTLHAFRCKLIKGEPQAIAVADWRWVLVDDLNDYPMGKIDRMIARQLADQTALI